MFYHRLIAPNKKASAGIWQEISKTQSYKIWLGYAFESLCIKHIDKVKRALGIANVYTEISSFQQIGDVKNNGFQIDIIIDRADKSINICECKYYTEPFEITKAYASALNQRKDLFKQQTQTKKNVFTTLICNQAVKKNDYFYQTVDKIVLLEDLL